MNIGIKEIMVIVGLIVTCGIGIASIFVKLTPNDTDNKILAIVIKIARVIGLYT